MRPVAFALALLFAVCTADAKEAPVHHWSCADVPFWVRGYSLSTIASTAANFGMTHWQIDRLLRCFPQKGY